MTLTDPSTRVALAAFLHDIGKLAERAGIDHAGRLDAHKNLYCPWHREGGYLSPTIVEAILKGQFPAHLTMKDLIAPFPMEWGRQREHFFGRGGTVKGG